MLLNPFGYIEEDVEDSDPQFLSSDGGLQLLGVTIIMTSLG